MNNKIKCTVWNARPFNYNRGKNVCYLVKRASRQKCSADVWKPVFQLISNTVLQIKCNIHEILWAWWLARMQKVAGSNPNPFPTPGLSLSKTPWAPPVAAHCRVGYDADVKFHCNTYMWSITFLNGRTKARDFTLQYTRKQYIFISFCLSPIYLLVHWNIVGTLRIVFLHIYSHMQLTFSYFSFSVSLFGLFSVLSGVRLPSCHPTFWSFFLC